MKRCPIDIVSSVLLLLFSFCFLLPSKLLETTKSCVLILVLPVIMHANHFTLFVHHVYLHMMFSCRDSLTKFVFINKRDMTKKSV